MTYLAAGIVVAMVLAGSLWVLRGLLRSDIDALTSRLEAPSAQPATSETESLRAQYALLVESVDSRFEELTIAVSEGIKHVDRAENRIRSTIQRAQEKLRESGVESPGLEAEAAELRLIDAGPSEPERVPQVLPDVVQSESSVPGVSVEQLQRARAL